MLADQNRLKPFVHRLMASPSTLIDAGIEVRRDLAVASSFASLRKRQPSTACGLGELPSRMLFGMALHGNLFRGHKSSPSLRGHQLGSRTVSDWRHWPGDHGCLGGWGTNSRCLF